MVVWVAESRESNTELLLLAIRFHGELYAEKYSNRAGGIGPAAQVLAGPVFSQGS